MSNIGWSEIESRAREFSEDWGQETHESGESQTFYNEFFKIFGKTRRDIAYYERSVKKLGKRQGYIDLLWPGVLIVEHKSAGKDLDKAAEQADEYIGALKQHDKPFHLLVCDFQRFQLFDLKTNKKEEFTLAELPKKIHLFPFMLEDDSAFYEEQKELSIDASKLMGQIHVALRESGYKGEKLEIFLTRLTFCMFADNTGIFEKPGSNYPLLFKDLISQTEKDGSNTGERIAKIFETLDQDPDKGEREANLDEHIAKLPYINGDLFKELIPIPSFDSTMRSRLWDAVRFDWSDISPAIFGSMFQSVMNAEERRKQGAHYTGERDILKVINSLFMNNLRHEFERIKARPIGRDALLKEFQNKLAEMTFFDPACGCGNFLVIAYRELRWLEIEILLLLHSDGKGKGKLNKNVDMDTLSKIDVHQFYGIELDDFAVHIALSALWMMDHFMNRELSALFKKPLLRIPLEKSPTIRQGDALDKDWAGLLPPEKCSFIFGNPPFAGQSYQSKKQREQMRTLTNPNGKNASPLDYVGAWFLKSAAYVRQAEHNIPFAFVATNSVTQGEQVAMLWEPLLNEHKLEIIFAHQTFVWESEAPGKAAVHVVIVGLEKQEHARDNRMLFSYEDSKGEPAKKSVVAISPYLFDASRLGNLANPNLIIQDLNNPITPRPVMKRGVQPTDGGHYIFHTSDIALFENKEPKAKKFMRPFVGAKELIYGKKRSILYLEHATPNELATMPEVRKLIELVIKERESSKKPATQKMALYPTLLEGKAIPNEPFLAVPQVSSTNREYIPIDFLSPPTIPSNLINIISGATLADFAMLTSAMHMAWMRTVAGRLKSDYRYSIGLIYNTFPLPEGKDLSILEPFGQAILDARKSSSNTTLATHYKGRILSSALRRAHQKNDKAVDKLYSAKGFANDTERINHLFALYEKQTAK